MHKKIRVAVLATTLLTLGASAAQAQVTIGPRVGLNAANIRFDLEDADDEPDTKLLFGPQLGLVLNAQLGNLAIQPALLFSQKGYRVKSEDEFMGVTVSETASLRLSYLEVPINFVYNTAGEDGGFQVFAGPYVGFGLAGKYKYAVKGSGSNVNVDIDEEESVKFASKEGNDDKYYVRGVDFGANFGLGYKAGPFQTQLGYGLGLGNLIPDSDSGQKPDDAIKNGVIQLSFTYLFSSK